MHCYCFMLMHSFLHPAVFWEDSCSEDIHRSLMGLRAIESLKFTQQNGQHVTYMFVTFNSLVSRYNEFDIVTLTLVYLLPSMTYWPTHGILIPDNNHSSILAVFDSDIHDTLTIYKHVLLHLMRVCSCWKFTRSQGSNLQPLEALRLDPSSP